MLPRNSQRTVHDPSQTMVGRSHERRRRSSSEDSSSASLHHPRRPTQRPRPRQGHRPRDIGGAGMQRKQERTAVPKAIFLPPKPRRRRARDAGGTALDAPSTDHTAVLPRGGVARPTDRGGAAVDGAAGEVLEIARRRRRGDCGVGSHERADVGRGGNGFVFARVRRLAKVGRADEGRSNLSGSRSGFLRLSLHAILHAEPPVHLFHRNRPHEIGPRFQSKSLANPALVEQGCRSGPAKRQQKRLH
mmetsp:Transcript_14445/g.31407  ORF Transcript_14445/g.31407 Transcript_14445/m.31407 type:complete len:246 (-) Transcript_14445:1018-1755(-)